MRREHFRKNSEKIKMVPCKRIFVLENKMFPFKKDFPDFSLHIDLSKSYTTSAF